MHDPRSRAVSRRAVYHPDRQRADSSRRISLRRGYAVRLHEAENGRERRRHEDDGGQFVLRRGYDHCFVFDKARDKSKPYGVLYSPRSGIEMKCYTDMPAVQFYAGNGLDQTGKKGHRYGRCGGLCLETQAIPNNVNVEAYAAYGSSILPAGETYRFAARYAFGVRR
ncbi:MAG: hypothetical protein ACLR06_14490 [Christensenellaceae bacterium]